MNDPTAQPSPADDAGEVNVMRYCGKCGAEALEADVVNQTPAGAFNCPACGNPFHDHPNPHELAGGDGRAVRSELEELVAVGLGAAGLPPELEAVLETLPDELRPACVMLGEAIAGALRVAGDVDELSRRVEALEDELDELNEDLDDEAAGGDTGGADTTDGGEAHAETPTADADKTEPTT